MSEPLKKTIREQVQKEVATIKSEIDTILLDDISRGIRKIVETIPEGVDVPIGDKTVTSVKPEIIELAHVPLRSVYLFNKGPNTVYYRINDDPTENSIEDRESIKVERPRRTIVKITLRTNVGESATVKSSGEY